MEIQLKNTYSFAIVLPVFTPYALIIIVFCARDLLCRTTLHLDWAATVPQGLRGQEKVI
jgi:hypothetical protein